MAEDHGMYCANIVMLFDTISKCREASGAVYQPRQFSQLSRNQWLAKFQTSQNGDIMEQRLTVPKEIPKTGWEILVLLTLMLHAAYLSLLGGFKPLGAEVSILPEKVIEGGLLRDSNDGLLRRKWSGFRSSLLPFNRSSGKKEHFKIFN